MMKDEIIYPRRNQVAYEFEPRKNSKMKSAGLFPLETLYSLILIPSE
jgi:hypothetical protein